MAKATEQTETIEMTEQPTQAAVEATVPATETSATTEPTTEPGQTLTVGHSDAVTAVLIAQVASLQAELGQKDATIAEQTAEIERLGNVLVSATSQGPSPVAVEPVPGQIPGCVAGRIVYYTPGENERFAGDALIVGILTKVWDTTTGCANIHLFPDGDNQNPEGLRPFVTSRMFDAAGDRTPATYRFTR